MFIVPFTSVTFLKKKRKGKESTHADAGHSLCSSSPPLGSYFCVLGAKLTNFQTAREGEYSHTYLKQNKEEERKILPDAGAPALKGSVTFGLLNHSFPSRRRRHAFSSVRSSPPRHLDVAYGGWGRDGNKSNAVTLRNCNQAVWLSDRS